MKFRLLLLVLVLTLPPAFAQKKKKNAPPPPPAPFALQNEADSVSYALGLSFMQSIKGLGLDSLYREAFWQAWQDVQQGQTTKMTSEGAQQFLTTYFQGMQARKAEASRIAGEKFLAENQAKAGVTTLPSGLQYQVVTPGTGAKPTANDRVRVHYRGTLLDGKQFDSSYDRGEPAVFGVGQVIRGWTEALQLMPVGSKWKLFIPATLAYGDRGAGADIPPGSTLIFDVELLGIEK